MSAVDVCTAAVVSLESMSSLAVFLKDLSDEYLALHTRKEDLFWEARMGLAADIDAAQERLSHAEIALNRFLQAPERLKQLRDRERANTGSERDRIILAGWIAMF